jgi:hypothetical protein
VSDAGGKTFEILDGMQRLNAVFSFIENGYDVDSKYFDVEQLARAKQMAEAGRFRAVARDGKRLDAQSCARLLEYTFAVTEFPATDTNAVNDVFGRINAYGRQLSSQEKRQAGVVSVFASCVREISSELRGDSSANSLDLSEMPQISIDVSSSEPEYGVRADTTFWCKQGILRRNQLREAEDEQFVADLAISILEEEPFAFSGALLDDYYAQDSEQARSINIKLNRYGIDALKNAVISTVSIVRETIESVDTAQNALRRVLHPEAGANPIKTGFYSVFMAFYELCIKEGKSPFDANGIIAALHRLQDRLEVAAGQIRSEPRARNIAVTKGLIQAYFVEKDPPATKLGAGLAIRFENALRRSKIETSAYECKQGLLSLDDTRTQNAELLPRILETICGIANIGPDSQGAVFIGVADNVNDKQRIEALDGTRALEVGARYVVGVDRELNYLRKTLEAYTRAIVDYIASSSLSEPLKGSILASIDCIDYRGLSIVCIWIPSQRKVSDINDIVFTRKGAATERVEGLRATNSVAERFEI